MEKEVLLLKNIERFGEKYCSVYLDWDKSKLEKDWWYALDFFFSHSFMRGRTDKLSNEYYTFAVEALKGFFSINSKNIPESYQKVINYKKYFDKGIILNFKKEGELGKKNSISKPGFTEEVEDKNSLIKHLIKYKRVKIKGNNSTYEKEVHLGNDEDIMMVLDVLNFISTDNKKQNIYTYLRNGIQGSGVNAVYTELNKLRAIGDKIATFIIRDILLMNAEMNTINFDVKLAFPVDTWVEQVAEKLGYTKGKKTKDFLISKCKENRIDPLKFAAGLWFLGMHSLDILIKDCLGKIKIQP